MHVQENAALSLPPVPPDPVGVCQCGATLYAVADHENHWQWVDEHGRTYVPVDPSPYAVLRELYEKMTAGTASDDEATAYSVLKCRVDLGLFQWAHPHRPASLPPFNGTVPWCCDMPMRHAPSGWQCRETRVPHPRHNRDARDSTDVV